MELLKWFFNKFTNYDLILLVSTKQELNNTLIILDKQIYNDNNLLQKMKEFDSKIYNINNDPLNAMFISYKDYLQNSIHLCNDMVYKCKNSKELLNYMLIKHEIDKENIINILDVLNSSDKLIIDMRDSNYNRFIELFINNLLSSGAAERRKPTSSGIDNL